MLANLSPEALAALDRLKREPPATGPPQPNSQDGRGSLPPLSMVRPRTPLVAGVHVDLQDGNVAQVQVASQVSDPDPFFEAVNRWDVIRYGLDASNDWRRLIISGDLHRDLVEGSTIRIIDSDNALPSDAAGYLTNDGQYVLTEDVEYDQDDDESTLTVDRVLLNPLIVNPGVVVRFGSLALADIDGIHTAVAKTGAAGFPGDVLVVARIGGELISLTGAATIYGYLDGGLSAAVVVTDGDGVKRLRPGVAQLQVWQFAERLVDPDGDDPVLTEVWEDTGIRVPVTNLIEGVAMSRHTLVAASRAYGRWVLHSSSCGVSDLFPVGASPFSP